MIWGGGEEPKNTRQWQGVGERYFLREREKGEKDVGAKRSEKSCHFPDNLSRVFVTDRFT